MAAKYLHVAWDTGNMGAGATVSEGGFCVDFDASISIRGTEPLPLSGTVRRRLKVLKAGGNPIFGVCSDEYSKWSVHPAMETGSWTYIARETDGQMWSQNTKADQSAAWAKRDSAIVEAVFDAGVGRLAFEVDGQPLEGSSNLELPIGPRFYPVLGSNGGGSSLQSMPPPTQVPLQVFAQMYDGAVAFVCTTMGGEEVGRLSGLGAEDTGASLADLAFESVPAPPDTQRRLVLPDGTLLEKDKLFLPLRELFEFDKAAGGFEAEIGSEAATWGPEKVVATTAPTQRDLSKKRYSLNTMGKPDAGGVQKADPKVAELYRQAWDRHGGDKAKIIEELPLHEQAVEWTGVLDKEAFIKKFAGYAGD